MANLLKSDKSFQYLVPLLIGFAAIIFFHSVVAIVHPHYWQSTVWDEAWYGDVATNGYKLNSENYLVQSNVVFSPGWPLLVRIVMLLLNISFPHARLIATIFLFPGTCIGLYSVLNLFSSDRTQNTKALLLFVFSPASFYFLTGYSESLYIFLTVWFFYFLIKEQYLASAIIASLALFTRSPAIVLVVTLLITISLRILILYANGSSFDWRKLTKLFLVYMPVAFLGLLLYMLILQISVDDPFAFLKGYLAWGSYTTPRFLNFLFLCPITVFLCSHFLPAVWLGTILFIAMPLIIFTMRQYLPLSLIVFSLIIWFFFSYENPPFVHVIPYANILRHLSVLFTFQYAIVLILDKFGRLKNVAFLILLFAGIYYYQTFLRLFVNGQWVS